MAFKIIDEQSALRVTLEFYLMQKQYKLCTSFGYAVRATMNTDIVVKYELSNIIIIIHNCFQNKKPPSSWPTEREKILPIVLW